MYTIREVNASDKVGMRVLHMAVSSRQMQAAERLVGPKDNFILSPNIFDVAKSKGWRTA